MVCEDRISNLPSDIMISIISLLDIPEATATSILSTHWRHLHCYVTHLNFPKFIGSKNLPNHLSSLSKHQSMISHVLNSYRGNRIKLFRVDMSCVEVDKFERCFEFALIKKAETIHLLGVVSMSLEFLRLPNTILLHGLGCLKDLSLSYIHATDQDFEILVSNCLALESLTVEVSYNLKNVSIVGLSKLKQLKLTHFKEVQSIVIRDTTSLVNLTLYILTGGTSVQLSNIPKLTELNFEEDYFKLKFVELLAGMPSCIRDQLQQLRLVLVRWPLQLLDGSSVKLVNIKHLELELSLRDDVDFYVLRHVCSLVEACRSSEKLVLKFPHWASNHLRFSAKTYDEPWCELSLKYLEIRGYIGCTSERELALYVINSARALQELIVVCYHQMGLDYAHRDFRHIQSVRFVLMQLN